MKRVYLDKTGKVIRPYDLLKVVHFTGRRGKKHYMYKWVFEKEGFLCAYHLRKDGTYYYLPVLDPVVPLSDYEIIQSPLTLQDELERLRVRE